MSHLILIAVAAIGAMLCSFLQRDLYACAPTIQRAILRFACRFLPEEDRDEAFEQWWGDLCDLPRSELLRIIIALDYIRGGAEIGRSAREQAGRVERDQIASAPEQATRVAIGSQFSEEHLEAFIRFSEIMHRVPDEVRAEYEYRNGEIDWCDECNTWHDGEYHPYGSR